MNLLEAVFDRRLRSQVAKAADCKSATRGFNSHRSLFLLFGDPNLPKAPPDAREQLPFAGPNRDSC
jgi:hypothetical protein